MRVIIAARLSQLAEGQTGQESQDIEAREWAERMGYEVVATLADFKSGTSAPWNRPNLKPWVTEPARMALYDAVVAYRLDRLSRGDNASTNAIEDWATSHGKQLLTQDGLVFPCEGNAGIRWDITKRLAHEEWLGSSEKYRRMQRTLRRQGYHVGRAPYGFMIQPVPGTKHKVLVPDPSTRWVVREAVRRYLADETLAAIGADFTARGIMSSPCPSNCAKDHEHRQGEPWSPKTLSQVLRNPALCGRYSHGGEVIRHEGIVTLRDWERVQGAMDGRAHRKGVPPTQTAMLTSVAFCAICEGPMYRIKCRGRTYKNGMMPEAKFYYRCHGTSRKRSECANMASLKELDALVTSEILKLASKPYKELVPVPGHNNDDAIAQAKRDVSDLDQDAPDYDERYAALRAEVKRLQALPAVPDRMAERETDETIGQHWASLDDAGRRAALVSAGARVYVDATGPELLVRLVNVAPGASAPERRPAA